MTNRREFMSQLTPAILALPLQQYDSTAGVQWLGSPHTTVIEDELVGKGQTMRRFSEAVDLHLEIGLRPDGIVVWRRK